MSELDSLRHDMEMRMRDEIISIRHEFKELLTQQAHDHQRAIDEMREQFAAIAKVLHANVTTVDERIVGLEQRIDEHAGKIDQNGHSISMVDSRVGDQAGKLDNLKATITQLAEEMYGPSDPPDEEGS